MVRTAMSQHGLEVTSGERFEFGENWLRFLQTLDDERVEAAKNALSEMLGATTLQGRSFLDIGSGSGLSSLAARILGARVYSFDYDPQSVACTQELRARYFPNDRMWTIDSGSALDRGYMESLGRFNVVYSWGVLHHTGAMWDALENVWRNVASGGQLFIAIYNDQGGASHRWRAIKSNYNKASPAVRVFIGASVFLFFEFRSALVKVMRLQNPLPFKDWKKRKQDRGMSVWHDSIDWAGGYPFEVATPEQIFEFFLERGFELRRLRTCGGGHGCNEFVFKRA